MTESVRDLCGVHVLAVASMGPSSGDDGEVCALACAGVFLLASMGPSSADDGEGAGAMSFAGNDFRARLREVWLPVQSLHLTKSADLLSPCREEKGTGQTRGWN